MTESEVQQLIADAGEGLEASRLPLFGRFASRLLAGLESHPTGGPSALSSIVREAFEWLEDREPDEIRVRVRNREDRPGHTVLEVLQSDRPFILDTLELALARFGAEERFVIHPILASERSSSGRLVEVRNEAAVGPLESYVYIEIVPVIDDPASRRALEAEVRQVMHWLADVTADHRRMIRAVRELNANLEFASPHLEGGAERSQRVQSFLEWIVDGRFVLFGTRRYRVGSVGGENEVQIVPGTGLGMWRDDASSRFLHPLRGSNIPAEVQEDLDDPRVILISKSPMESRIHRAGRLDRILVKEHDEQGTLCGFTILVGLFTRRVLRTPGSQIPLLSARLRSLIERLGLHYGSHAHQAIVTAFDSLPIELLVGADVERLVELLPKLVAAASSKTVRLVARTHPRGRLLYAAVFIPREHYSEDLRTKIRALLEEQTGARYIDDRTSFVEEGTAIVHCFCTAAEGETIHADLAKLEEQIHQVCSPWEDQLLDAMRGLHEERAFALTARYERAFSRALRLATHPLDAVRDVEGLEALAATGEPQCALYFDRDDPSHETSTLRLYLREAPFLSDVLATVNHFGLQVVDARLFDVSLADLGTFHVESLRLVPLGESQDDLDAIAPRLSEAIRATLVDRVASDPLNALVIHAGLDWCQVDVLRAYVEYFVQIQGTLSRPYLWKVLRENPLAARALVHWFEARLAPDVEAAERKQREDRLRRVFKSYRDRISALNEDRALQGVFNLIEATLRTNVFAQKSDPHRVVLKLDSRQIEELSGTRPFREILVHSAAMSGVHLRGGPVARGGLRWSDRHDDFRVEVLGLMSTQMLKNCIIVPVGAKGGFVLHHDGLSPPEARAAADEQYKAFVSGLLDVTDNLSPGGEPIAPPGVHRRDDDDPYLVVAADKGTAHLSDTANEIALSRDFWLGDAFASGGSEGYDHKKYAITARGAWECVKLHLSEMGIHPERDPFEVAGIGDMSGDVFGNGLLLMRGARLLAAFDHRHVFLDPDPDPEAAWQERKRLFDLPRSTWADYSPDVLSEGGGVWPRGAKQIPVPAALRERLGTAAEASGLDVVRAVLRLDVDVLWNGGIGTYVKASHESQAEVGDRANDAVRIDAPQLRARIVGEGGNLGFTQAARVEASLAGVRLDTDAIHNSAGVDLSDHEVNYKIALAPMVRSGRLATEARRELLFAVVDEACEKVLSHNRAQALCISLDEIRSRDDPESFARAIDALSVRAGLAPEVLELPDPDVLAARQASGTGLARPELAVLLGLAKLHAQQALLAGEFSGHAYLDTLYRGYFPGRFRDECSDALDAHPLRREITALRVLNRLVDAGGATLFVSLEDELGAATPAAATALLLAEDVMRVPEFRGQLGADASTPRAAVYSALVELDRGVRTVAGFLLKAGLAELDAARAERWRAALDGLSKELREFLVPEETRRLDERRAHFEEAGLAGDLAARLASLPLADRGINILRVSEETSTLPIEAGRVYTRLGDAAGFDWMYERLSRDRSGSVWDRMALADLRHDMLDLQRDVTKHVLVQGGDPAAALARFCDARAAEITRIEDLQLRVSGSATPAALSVIAARLRALAP